MRRYSFLAWPVAALLGGIACYFLWAKPASRTLPVIAITQIIEHHTLDTVRTGLIDELAAQGFTEDTARIVYENAHGNVTTAAQISNKFASLHPEIMVALSTQSAQILYSQAISTHTPLVFTAVTNPVAAKLVPSATETSAFVTGVSDFMKPEPQLDMMQALVPSLTKLGILYNPSEINSVSFLKEMEEAAKAYGITLVYSALNNTAEASAATRSLAGKVDAIYFPNDNTAMAAVGTIATTALKYGIPVFANDSASVERGVLAAVAYDRYAMGRKTGEIAAAILKGKRPQDIPVVYGTPYETVVNEKTLAALNIAIPPSIKSIRKL